MTYVVNDINSTIELYRAILLNEFKITIFNVIKKNQPEISDMNIYKYFTNWILFQYIFEQKDDPLIPTNYNDNIIKDGLDLRYYNLNTYQLLIDFDYISYANQQIAKLVEFKNKNSDVKYEIQTKIIGKFIHFKYISEKNIEEFENNYYVTTDVKIPVTQYKQMIKQNKKHIDTANKPLSYYNIIIYNILIRYLAISSLGNQLAVHPNILNSLKKN